MVQEEQKRGGMDRQHTDRVLRGGVRQTEKRKRRKRRKGGDKVHTAQLSLAQVDIHPMFLPIRSPALLQLLQLLVQ